MIIYHYNPETGEFVGTSIAEESPREPEVFLIPSYATTAAVPETPPGKKAIFSMGQWVLEDIPTPDPEPEPAPVPELESPLTMERFALSQGYTTFDLLNLSDIERKLETENIPLPEKSSAVREWVNSVRVAFLTDQTPSPAPYSLDEVLEEILNMTQPWDTSDYISSQLLHYFPHHC